MKNILEYISIAAALLLGTVPVSCSGDVDTGDLGGALLSLKVFPEAIEADGVSTATFTISHEGEDISPSAVITCTTTGEEVRNCEFAATVAGDYKFTATYNNLKSNTVIVRALAPGEGVRVFLDKTEIEADGADAAKIILRDKNGKLLNEEQDFVYFEVLETGEKFERRNEFTAVEDGEYTIAVKFKGEPCANVVKLAAVNRSLYEKYYHMIPVYDVTNIQCGYCAVYAKGLDEMPQLYKDHTLVVGVHGEYHTNDPWLKFTSSVATNLMQMFGSTGYPTIIYNLDRMVPANDVEYTGAGISQRIVEQMKKYPATSGIKLSSSYDEAAGKVTAKVSMTSVQEEKYDIACALLLDNQDVSAHSSLFAEVDDILIAYSGNYYGMSVDGSFTSVVDGEESREWTFDLPSEFVAQSGGVQNFRLVGFSLIEEDGKVRFDNANVCPLGESADYRLN